MTGRNAFTKCIPHPISLKEIGPSPPSPINDAKSILALFTTPNLFWRCSTPRGRIKPLLLSGCCISVNFWVMKQLRSCDKRKKHRISYSLRVWMLGAALNSSSESYGFIRNLPNYFTPPQGVFVNKWILRVRRLRNSLKLSNSTITQQYNQFGKTEQPIRWLSLSNNYLKNFRQ